MMNRAVIFFFLAFSFSSYAWAGTAIPLTVNLSESVTVTGTPHVAVDVGGVTRYATYTSGNGTNALTFTLSPQAGDVDLDGITVSSPIDLNGGTIKDIGGNSLASLSFTPPNTSGIKVNYPSLGMDFVYDADGRYTLNGTVYNDLTSFLAASGGTFTRASVGTYYDSAGTLQTAASGVPRFDWDPVTHAAKGILIEESRTNTAKYSAQLDNAAWNKSASVSVTANTTDTLAPDGSYSAEKISQTSTSAAVFDQFNISISATSATYSIYVKQGSGATEANGYCFRNQTTSTNLICGTLNYTTGVFSYSTGSSGVTVTSISNGWMRIAFTATAGITSGDTLVAYAGYTGNTYAAGQYFYAWGAQVEAGAFATSYIPTTSAAVTRAADSLTFPATSWYNASEGSLYTQGAIPVAATTTRRFATLSDGTINNTIQLANSSSGTTGYMEVRDGSAVQVTMTNGTFTAGSTVKSALAYKLDDFLMSVNGTAPVTDTSGTVPATINKLTLGSHNAGGNYINGGLKVLKYYPAHLSATQLQLLTQ